jgi:hypothetical protein
VSKNLTDFTVSLTFGLVLLVCSPGLLNAQGTNQLNMIPVGPVPSASPGTQIGTTTFDEQHYGSMGRQVAHNIGIKYTHFYYTGQFSNDLIYGPRFVYYAVWDNDAEAYVGSGSQVTSDMSYYASGAVQLDNRAVVAFNIDSASTGTEKSALSIDAMAAFGMFNTVVFR